MLAFAAVPAPGAQTTAADVLALLDGQGLLREVALAPGDDARSITLDGFGATGKAGPATLAGAWIAAAGTGFAGGMLLCDPRSRGDAAPAPGRVIAVCERPRLAFALATERFFSHLVVDRAPKWHDPAGPERAAHAGAWVMNASIGQGVTLGPHCVIGGASMGFERDARRQAGAAPPSRRRRDRRRRSHRRAGERPARIARHDAGRPGQPRSARTRTSRTTRRSAPTCSSSATSRSAGAPGWATGR